MKVAELAKKINWDAKKLFKELVKRSIQIKSIHGQLRRYDYEIILQKYKELGDNFSFDQFTEVSKEYRNGTREAPLFDPKPSKIFEDKVGNLISYYHPNSHLSGVFLYIADLLKDGESSSVFGRELDHLMHLQDGHTNRIYIIECKNQPIQIDKEKQIGYVTYSRSDNTVIKSSVYKQLKMQIRAILQMVKPVDEMDLEIHAYAISSNNANDLLETEEIFESRKLFFKYMSFSDFDKELQLGREELTVLRVGESELLRRLRQGKPCSHLGHPDIRDAIEYRNRLRLTLDLSLFDYFQPKGTGKWAINGTAGMGKTVLLAYTACVMSLDCVIKVNNGKAVLEKYNSEERGFSSFDQRRILIFALNIKQRAVVEEFFKELVTLFKSFDTEEIIKGEKRPRFEVWSENKIANANVILIDEAHDLDSPGQLKIARWSEQDGNYLIIACDRHQKLRLSNEDDAKLMIEGLNFSRETTKLKRVYRNPFSVYAAGLALMFRWFAPEGKKIIPPPKVLKESFGFNVNLYDLEAGMGCKFEMVEDSHPANNWHHCLSDFPSPEMAYNWLNQYKLTDNRNEKDVLWVTFSFCDHDFDYEKVQSDFVYQDLTNPVNNQRKIDSSIKGQEFSIVVIEGVGPEFNNFEDEEAMLRHRRELYLCASRATVFLFFVHDNNQTQTVEKDQIKKELKELRKKLSRPSKPSDATQFWEVKFDADLNNIINFKQYEDLVDPITEPEPTPEPEPGPEPTPEPEPGPEPTPESEPETELEPEDEPDPEDDGLDAYQIAAKIKTSPKEAYDSLKEAGFEILNFKCKLALTEANEFIASYKPKAVTASNSELDFGDNQEILPEPVIVNGQEADSAYLDGAIVGDNSKVRIHALAKKVKRTPQENIKILTERGDKVTSATSEVDAVTANPESKNKQNAKSITMYSKEMSPNELANKLGVSFSELLSAKEEIGRIWTSEKLDFYKAKEICSKFGFEIIDKSPKDNF